MRGMGHGRFFHAAGRFAAEDEKPQRITFKQISRLLKYLKPHKSVVILSLFISISATILHLIPPRLMGIIIDRCIIEKNLRLLLIMAFSMLVISILSHLLGGIKSFLIGKLGQKIVFTMWQDVYRSLQYLSFSFYDNRQTGDIMSRITGDVGAVERAVVNGVDQALISILTLIGITIILFWMNLKLAIIAIIPIPALIILIWLFSRKAYKTFRKVRKKMGEVNALLQDNISGIREVKSFGQEKHEINKLHKKGSEYINVNVKAIKLWSTFFPLMATTTSIGIFLVLLFGGKIAITTNTLSTGELVAFLFYLRMFYQPISQLNMVNYMLQHARAGSERIFEIMDTVPQVKEAPDAVNLPRPIKGKVTFENIYFSYPKAQADSKKRKPVLRGINLTANSGEIIALVGHTGAGKSTIARLIPRFYDSNEGIITVDNIDVKKLKLKDLRDSIGIVMQEPFLFNTTIKENITYGKKNSDMKDIIRVAKLANAHEFILKLPEGYDSYVGERGVKLSTGEKQRIAIARALLKDPPILILDEATSSVDNRTEALIQEATKHLLRKRTSFVIAHRLSTVMNADKIAVIQNGKIVELGTHKQLLAKKGIYRELYQSQWRNSNIRYTPR